MEQLYTLHERMLVDREHRYLSLIHRFLNCQTDFRSFRQSHRNRWIEEREELWQAANRPSQRDFRPLTRLLDRLNAACTTGSDPDDLCGQVQYLLDAYRAAKAGDPASALAAPPRLPLFERPLPDGWVYPCTVKNIRHQLVLVPEQDLEGLVSIGLTPPTRAGRGCYGTYWFDHWRERTPVIFLHARPLSGSFKTRRDYSIGEVQSRFSVELLYGMRVERAGSRVLCHWEPPCLRRYMAEHVLLHEIGHHVQRRQRERTRLSLFPGDRACEQFADGYAMRTVRRKKGGRYR